MKIFSTILLLSYYSTLIGMQSPVIKNSKQGLLVLEFNIDSVWIEKNQIHSTPTISSNTNPGSIKFPCFKTPLIGVPSNASIIVFRSDPKLLKKFKPIYNSGEKSSDGENIIPYNNPIIHQFNPGDVLLKSGVSTELSDIHVLKTSIIDEIDEKWVWYPKTTIQINWDNPSKGNLFIDNSSNKSSTNPSNSFIIF